MFFACNWYWSILQANLIMLNPAQFANQLVSNERHGQDKLNNSKLEKIEADTTAYETLSSSLKKVDNKLSHFRNAHFNNKAAVISDKNAAITVENNAPLGRFDLTIKQLATADQLVKTFDSETAALPTKGKLSFEIDGKPLVIDLASFQQNGKPYTIENLRDTINISTTNPGIQASLVRTGHGVDLLLSSAKTGAKQQINVTLDDKPWAGVKELVKPQDAKVVLNGIDIDSNSNQLTNVIDGVNIELKQVHEANKSSAIEISSDLSKNKTEVNQLVGALNTLLDDIGGLTFAAKPGSYESSGSKADKMNGDSKDGSNDASSSSHISSTQVGALKNDSSVRRLKQSISQLAFFSTASGLRMSDLGIELTRDGSFKVDEKKLDVVFKNNPKEITELLSFKGGVLGKLDQIVKPFAKFDGFVDNKTKMLQEQEQRLKDEMDAFNVEMKQKYTQYLKQFTAMEKTIDNLNSAGDIFGQLDNAQQQQ